MVEVQIRTERMDEIAEKGLAAITNTKKTNLKTPTAPKMRLKAG